MLIRRIRQTNLLSFGPDSEAIELKRLNVLIGPNGSGKSTSRPFWKTRRGRRHCAINSPWEHLKRRDDWTQPAVVSDDGAQLMVQCMEARFVADRQSLSAYFGRDFGAAALPARDNVETIAKNDLKRTLKQATKSCAKGPYRKGRHSFDLLGCLDPSKVIESSHHARQLMDALRRPRDSSCCPLPTGLEAAIRTQTGGVVVTLFKNR